MRDIKNILLICFLLINLFSCRKQDKDIRKVKTETQAEKNIELKTSSDQIKISQPQQDQIISSPQELKGKARGYWFFEAEATVELLNANYKKIAQSNITAQGEWMTDDWVKFEGKLSFTNPATKIGFLVFHKANPSGLEERALSDTIKVRFLD